MRYANHNVLSMEVDPKKTASSELNLKAADPVTRLEEVSGKHEEMEGNQVAVKQTLQDLKSVFV